MLKPNKIIKIMIGSYVLINLYGCSNGNGRNNITANFSSIEVSNTFIKKEARFTNDASVYYKSDDVNGFNIYVLNGLSSPEGANNTKPEYWTLKAPENISNITNVNQDGNKIMFSRVYSTTVDSWLASDYTFETATNEIKATWYSSENLGFSHNIFPISGTFAAGGFAVTRWYIEGIDTLGFTPLTLLGKASNESIIIAQNFYKECAESSDDYISTISVTEDINQRGENLVQVGTSLGSLCLFNQVDHNWVKFNNLLKDKGYQGVGGISFIKFIRNDDQHIAMYWSLSDGNIWKAIIDKVTNKIQFLENLNSQAHKNAPLPAEIDPSLILIDNQNNYIYIAELGDKGTPMKVYIFSRENGKWDSVVLNNDEKSTITSISFAADKTTPVVRTDTGNIYYIKHNKNSN